jgi:hypothetical protein
MSGYKLNSRTPALPPRDQIADDAPLRLDLAAALAYPDGSMTASGLRREAKPGTGRTGPGASRRSWKPPRGSRRGPDSSTARPSPATGAAWRCSSAFAAGAPMKACSRMPSTCSNSTARTYGASRSRPARDAGAPRLQARLRGHCVEAARLAVCQRPHPTLAQVQEPGGPGGEARGGGRLGEAEVTRRGLGLNR